MPISRRDLLLAGTAAAALGVPGGAGLAQTTPGVAEFLALSQQLTGVQNMDPAVAKTLLGGLLATGKGSALSALMAGSTAPDARELGDAIVGAWYSGVYDTGRGQAVATFDRALVWQALSFTKPWGLCGGDTGYWADPA